MIIIIISNNNRLIAICYSLHVAINDDVAWERVYDMYDILRKFPGHNFVSDLRTLKPKKLKT